ncbi:pyridoxal phosphate-dependent aminotransferase [Laceyella tengchongensis]
MISHDIANSLNEHSWIRVMFQEGKRLKQLHGEEHVFDFSIGGPALEPPEAFYQSLRQVVDEPLAGKHSYGDYQGLYEARERIAAYLANRYQTGFSPAHVVMTSGAAGALNLVFRSILNPGDEVVLLAPYFLEYERYVTNFGGACTIVPLTEGSFDIDIDRVKEALTDKTKAIMVNSPHNPTGKVFSQENLSQLGRMMAEWEAETGRQLFLVYDSPYDQLTFVGTYANPFSASDRVIFVGSFSKELGLAGERVGYIALNEAFEHKDLLAAALAYCNRVMGFLHAPMLMQRAIAGMGSLEVDASPYRLRSEMMSDILREAGFSFLPPQGGFFIFPKSPIPDDVAFCMEAMERFHLLVVPGSQFGRAGHFRVSFSVSLEQIQRSKDVFCQLRAFFGGDEVEASAGMPVNLVE